MKKFSIILLLVISFQLFFSTVGSAVNFKPISIELSPILWDKPLGPIGSKSPARENFVVSYTDNLLMIKSTSDDGFEVDIANDYNQVEIHKEYASGVGTYSISLAGLSDGDYTIYITTKKGTLYGTFSLDNGL